MTRSAAARPAEPDRLKETQAVIGPLHRRPALERGIVRLLRGAPAAADYFNDRGVAASEERSVEPLSGDFARLRESAQLAGFELLAPDARFVSEDEIDLVGWIGESQRMGHAIYRYGLAPDVARGIVRCGARLTMLGLRLSPLTIQAIRARRPNPSRLRPERTPR